MHHTVVIECTITIENDMRMECNVIIEHVAPIEHT